MRTLRGARRNPAAKAPAEGALTTFTDRNAKDVPTQVARLTQEVFKLKTELIVFNFRQEYADRIGMQRVSYPANTADKEAIPAAFSRRRKCRPAKNSPRSSWCMAETTFNSPPTGSRGSPRPSSAATS